MHFIQLLPCILASATVAVAQLVIPAGPLATFYSQPGFVGDSYAAEILNDCLQLPKTIIGNVNSVKLTELPSPYYISCTLYSNDYCRDPGASAIFYAISLFENAILPNPKIRSVSCTSSRLLPRE